MTTFSIQSFGCRVNQAESFFWADEFQKHGLRYQDDFKKSDLIVINTCTVTSRADRDVRNFLRKITRINPGARVVITGCYVDGKPQELREISPNWKVFFNREKRILPDLILSDIDPGEKTSPRSLRSRAFIKIQDGCDFNCTFCVVPFVRGKSFSFEINRIVGQIEKSLEQGYREVVLTGVHLCLYGRDLKPQKTLLVLLKDLEKIHGLGKIRLGSIDPRFLSTELLEYLVSNKRICPHFHLSLQHCSDNIIRRMGRKISATDYKRILEFFRQRSSFSSLGADIIAGFPGESWRDFEQMMAFLEDSPLTYFHVFSYSPRPGTEAAKWPGVNTGIRKRRADLLRKLSLRKNFIFRSKFVGKKNDAVVIKSENRSSRVLTSNYFDVFVPNFPLPEKQEVKVRITKVKEKETFGEIV